MQKYDLTEEDGTEENPEGPGCLVFFAFQDTAILSAYFFPRMEG